MTREKVESSLIASVGYEIENQVLEIEFTNGAVYQYFDFPPDEHENLKTAIASGESLGAFFNENIKGGGYRFIVLQ
ncbi:MAG: KTSC domain-containing protein [Pyrinomonadaceae bacterium]|nr:KTSC domain-containing protein [Pyrinomonadaceae bacterium]